ncbi:MAG: Dabb family protein [Balneolaceae bacterium]
MKKIYLLLFVLLVFTGFTSCQQTSADESETITENTTGMLQHTVYFYLNEEVSQEEADQFEEGLKQLLEIESIHKSELGIPGDTESRDVTDHSFAYSIFTWFENLDDYKAYDEHPDHLEFIDTYSSLWADVKVYDSELIE